ncbi:MAG: hypothetical protein EAZ42_06560 [Verrucomicrobia bacterium]|nr:MAG: hypothetical protein EAZ42_06560 [Verrucomicrobiota bacterium]
MGGITYPEGFENGGKRLIAECPEFSLWEKYDALGEEILEISDSIKNILTKISRGINDADDFDERIKLSTALSHLAGHAQTLPSAKLSLEQFTRLDPWSYGNARLSGELAETLGKQILAVISSTDPKQKAEECVGKFRNALDMLIRENSAQYVFATEHLLIRVAMSQFFSSRIRPSKSSVRAGVERLGVSYRGKNANATWKDKFMKAGLGDLPY